jgi:hypothetical protein
LIIAYIQKKSLQLTGGHYPPHARHALHRRVPSQTPDLHGLTTSHAYTLQNRKN